MDSNLRSIKEAICENLRIILQGNEDRHAAEDQLSMLETKEDYGLLLMELSLSEEIDFSLRHLASVLLDQYVAKHWCRAEESFKEPEVSPQLKPILREYLLKSLTMTSSNSSDKMNHEIKRIIGMFAHAISRIVMYDWSESWPIVFPVLIQYLTQFSTPSAVHASLNVFEELSNEICDAQIPASASVLCGTMLGIYGNQQQFSLEDRSTAITIFGTISDTIMTMNEYDGKSFNAYLDGFLPQFAECVVQTLSQPQSFTNEDYHLRMSTLDTLNKFIKDARKQLEQFLPKIMEFVWQNLTVSAQKYSQVASSGGIDASGCDLTNSSLLSSDFETKFDTFIYSIFDFVGQIFQSKKYRSLIKPVLGDLLYFIMFYGQITDEQIDHWSSDAETFTEEENLDGDAFCVRNAALLLFNELTDEMCTSSKNASVNRKQNDLIFKKAFLEALNRHFANANELQKNGRQDWWKSIEACFYCLGLISEDIVATVEEDKHPLAQEYKAILETLLIYPDKIQTPFLAGRSCWAAAKYSTIMNEQSLNNFLSLTGKLLMVIEQPALRILALKATFYFCENHQESLSKNWLKPHLSTFLEGLVSIGMNVTGVTLSDVLDTIKVLLKIDHEFTGSVSAQISALAISASLDYCNDDSMLSSCLDILEQIVAVKECQQIVAGRILFTIISVLRQSQSDKKSDKEVQIAVKNFHGHDMFKHINASALNLLPNAFLMLSFLLKNCDYSFWNNDIIREIYPLCITCIRSANQYDSAILTNGTGCLRYFVEKCSPALQTYFDPSSNCNGIGLAFNICIDLLNPQIPEVCSTYIGKLVVLLIIKGNLDQDKIQMLLRSSLVKLNTSNSLMLNQSLIVAFAHLLYFEMTTILLFLNTYPSPNGDKSALEFMLDRWLSSQVGFIGYENKATVLALCRLFQHSICGENGLDNEMANINLNRIEVNIDDEPLGCDRILTRSQTKSQQVEKIKKVPCTVKILKLLINEYVHLCEIQKRNDSIKSDSQQFCTSDSDQDSDYDYNSGDVYDFDDDISSEDDDILNDEIAAIDLWEALQNILRDFRNKCIFGADFMPHLTQEEKDILQSI